MVLILELSRMTRYWQQDEECFSHEKHTEKQQ